MSEFTRLLQRSKAAAAGFAVLVLLLIAAIAVMSSVRFVGSNKVGIVRKNALGPSLPAGQIIATDGEMGPQAEVLPPGWHFWYWPIVYDVTSQPLVEIPQGRVGLVEARDGLPLSDGQLFAPEVPSSEFKRMIEDAEYFLGTGDGHKGPQSNVLAPGAYRINTELFKVTIEDALNVPNANAAVLKANFGTEATLKRVPAEGAEPVLLALENEKGIRNEPLTEGQYPVNTKAFELTLIRTKETILRFTAASAEATRRTGRGQSADQRSVGEESAITVRTSDGFTFPVDVRIEYKILPSNAPIVVATLENDGQPLVNRMYSAVRAIFRNNAEDVKALDYVNQRSKQESESLEMLKPEMARLGITVTAVRIGDVGNEETLGELLKTQRNREIALQQQVTFQEQERAAEQQKALERTQQEAQEERRLATARYEVSIAEEAQQQRIIEAEAKAEANRSEAEAQAQAFQRIADQVGSSNAALLELLRIVGDTGIGITPRVMVNNTAGGRAGGQSGADGETVALIGTMLDTMLQRQDEQTPAARRAERTAAANEGTPDN